MLFAPIAETKHRSDEAQTDNIGFTAMPADEYIRSFISLSAHIQPTELYQLLLLSSSSVFQLGCDSGLDIRKFQDSSKPCSLANNNQTLMLHSISFDKKCRRCNQTTWLRSSVKIIDQTSSFNTTINKGFVPILDYIEKCSKEDQYKCDNCGETDNFIFYDVEVDDKPMGQHHQLIEKTHEKLIDSDHTLMFHATIKSFTIDRLTRLSPDYPGTFEINDSIIKIISHLPDTSSPFGFKQTLELGGEVLKMTYNSSGDIDNVFGETDNGQYALEFQMKRDVSFIGGLPVSEEKNICLKKENETGFFLTNLSLIKP